MPVRLARRAGGPAERSPVFWEERKEAGGVCDHRWGMGCATGKWPTLAAKPQSDQRSQATPGPGSPVVATCGGDAVQKHAWQCSKAIAAQWLHRNSQAHNFDSDLAPDPPHAAGTESLHLPAYTRPSVRTNAHLLDSDGSIS